MPKSTIFFMIPVLAVIITIPSASALEENGVIEMPFTDNPPVIDGKWTTMDEWKDASHTSIGSAGNNIIILVKHDRNYLYIMADAIRDFSNEAMILFYVFDTNNNGGLIPDSEDVMISAFSGKKINYYKWMYNEADPQGGWWGGEYAPGSISGLSLSAANDPFESTIPHKIVETKIPISYLNKNDKYGFGVGYVKASAIAASKTPIPDDAIIWPETVDRSYPYFAVPDKWGTLEDPKKQVTIPPIPVMQLSQTSLSFGSMAISEISSPKTVTISNQGTSALKINDIRVSGDFSIMNIDAPLDIEPGQNANLNVIFAPTTLGEKLGILTISSNDLSKPTYTISVEGTGVEKGQLGGGCLIATATYDSELAPQVQFLREIRDNTVLGTHSGTAFMSVFNSFYYLFSPTIADLERQNPMFKEAVKIVIMPLISTLGILQHVDIDSEAEMIGYGIGVILLNVGMYFVAPLLLIHRLRK